MSDSDARARLPHLRAVTLTQDTPPAPLPTGDALPAFTVQEEAFLRHYSDYLNRQSAMQYADLAPTGALPAAEARQVMTHAGQIVARSERMPLAQIATAVGLDRLVFLGILKRICLADELHVAVKGINILARIHGVWTDTKGSRQQVALVFAPPQAPPGSARPTDLPFTLPSGDYTTFGDTSDEVPRET